jgi:hypothetical protein
VVPSPSVNAVSRLLQAAFWLVLIGGIVSASAYFLILGKGKAPVAGKYYGYQLEWEHGLWIGSPYLGDKAFVGALERRGFKLSRRMMTDDYEFISPGGVYLLRVKTHKGKVSAFYHYVLDHSTRPAKHVNFLGDSIEEVKKELGEPSLIAPTPVLRYLYELEDADLSVAFGKDGWVVETVMQRPVRRSSSD